MDRVRRVVITGATGLLGRALLDTFENSSFLVQGWGFSRADGSRVKRVDVTCRPDVTRALESLSPDVVIHAAAERHPDVIEKDPEGAHELNVGATQYLAQECARLGAKLIYISTDYVFDGKDPPYSESSTPNPLNAYGETKLSGEEATRAAAESHVIFRVPILFGEVQQLDESAVTILFKALRDVCAKCKMDHVQLRYPTHVKHVSAALYQFSLLYLDAVKEGADVDDAGRRRFGGVFHFSARERLTKYEMAMSIAAACGIDASHVEADAAGAAAAPTQAKRPHHAQLSCERLEKLGIVWNSNFKEEIKVVLQPFM